MKKIFYIFVFTVLGLLLQFTIHAVLEIWYIRLLLTDFSFYGLGFSWAQWNTIHFILSWVLALGGGFLGFYQGKYWWNQIYVLKRYFVKKKT